MGNEKPWGGSWTEQKLDAFENYVIAYLTIMNMQPQWKTIYFDGFAGSGRRKVRKPNHPLLFPISDEEQKVYRGAAERVIRMKPPYTFDYYYFVEENKKRLDKLRDKLTSIPEAENKILVFRPNDCNEELRNLSNALKTDKYASLVFLDPFGMQVDWNSIASLSGTRSDVWLLLPTAVIINRLLDRKGKLKNLKRLESFFGLSEEEIRKEFYVPTGQTTFVDDMDEHTKKVMDPINKISSLYINRLSTIWQYVSDTALRLTNRKGAPLFHFVFASNNDKALKIANYIITKR